VRTDIDLAGPEYTDCQRDAATNLSAAKAEGRTLLSLGHNMAQANAITAALTEVLTEFIHNPAMKPEDAQKQLAEAAAASQ